MQWLNDWQLHAFDKFDKSNELSSPKHSDVNHKVPNDPKQALYPTSNAWLKLNVQLELYNFSYISVLSVNFFFFNLNSKSFFVRTKNTPQSIHVNIFLPSLTFFSHPWLWNRISGFLLIQFLPVNCSFSESIISLQYHCKVSFVDRRWNKWKNGEHHMVIIQGSWKSKLFLVIPPPAQSQHSYTILCWDIISFINLLVVLMRK